MADDAHEVTGRVDPERDNAERRYVAALVALDHAATPSTAVAASAAAAATDAVRLNDAWGRAPGQGEAGAPGPFRRLMLEIGRMLPWRRRRLHGAMIAAINRNTETTRALIDATQHFNSHVVWYAQTIGAFAGTARRGGMSPDSVEALQRAINGVGAEWLTHWESLAARERRYDLRIDALTRAYQELQDVASLAQQGTLALKRTVDRLADGQPASSPQATAAAAPAARDTDDYKYVGFEDRFRGSQSDIRERLKPYVPLFAGARNVVDIGCGRGELLDLLREAGVDARGIDVNDEMVGLCSDRGLRCERADGLAFLESQPDGSLGGLTAIQVVEHLEPSYLMRFLECAHQKLAPGAPMVLETINAACWSAFFDSYLRDLTHARPLHPDTLKYLVQASGFRSADVEFRSPIDEQDKLPTVSMPSGATDVPPALLEVIEAINAQAERLNSRLFTFRDYAVIAKK